MLAVSPHVISTVLPFVSVAVTFAPIDSISACVKIEMSYFESLMICSNINFRVNLINRKFATDDGKNKKGKAEN